MTVDFKEATKKAEDTCFYLLPMPGKVKNEVIRDKKAQLGRTGKEIGEVEPRTDAESRPENQSGWFKG